MPTRLRVVSWNVAVGRESSIQRVGEELARMNPDVVLLQEVDVGTRRSGGVDQARVLADALGASHSFAAAIPWDGGWYGQALLSRLPFADVQVRRLDPTGASEARIGLGAWLCLGPRTIRAVGFHADNIDHDSAARNAAEVTGWVTAELRDGAILAGDFNAEPTAPGPRSAIAAGLVDVLEQQDPRPTLLGRRIDFVFADAQLAGKVTAARVESSSASDHLPLLVDLQLP